MDEAVTHYCRNEACSMQDVQQVRWWSHRHPTTGAWGAWWTSSGKCKECGRVMVEAEEERETEEARQYRLEGAKVWKQAKLQTDDLLEQGRIYESWRRQWKQARK